MWWRGVLQVMSVVCGTVVLTGGALLPWWEGLAVLWASLGLFVLGFVWGMWFAKEDRDDQAPVDRGGGGGGGGGLRLVVAHPPPPTVRKPRQLHLRGGMR